MKKTLATILFLITFTAATCLAADAPASKPALNIQQQSVLLKAQRDYLLAQQQAQPYDQAAQQSFAAMQATLAKILKEVGADEAKWVFNPNNLEYSPAPPKKADDPKPVEKK